MKISFLSFNIGELNRLNGSDIESKCARLYAHINAEINNHRPDLFCIATQEEDTSGAFIECISRFMPQEYVLICKVNSAQKTESCSKFSLGNVAQRMMEIVNKKYVVHLHVFSFDDSIEMMKASDDCDFLVVRHKQTLLNYDKSSVIVKLTKGAETFAIAACHFPFDKKNAKNTKDAVEALDRTFAEFSNCAFGFTFGDLNFRYVDGMDTFPTGYAYFPQKSWHTCPVEKVTPEKISYIPEKKGKLRYSGLCDRIVFWKDFPKKHYTQDLGVHAIVDPTLTGPGLSDHFPIVGTILVDASAGGAGKLFVLGRSRKIREKNGKRYVMYKRALITIAAARRLEKSRA